MNKFYTLLLMAAVGTAAASAQSKFDASGRIVMNQYELRKAYPAAQHTPYAVMAIEESLSRGDAKASVIIILAPGASASDVEMRGFDILVDRGHMLIASGTLEDIAALAECDFVKSIAFGEERTPMLDVSRQVIGVDDVHQGKSNSWGQKFRGAGVIAGIFDRGIDPQHINFRDADNNTRIKAYWTFLSTGGTGRAYLTPDAIDNAPTDSRNDTHGTHTLGCMAGSFDRSVNSSSTNVAITNPSTGRPKGGKNANPYYGMAPDADLAVCAGQLYDSNILAGIANIVDYAKSQGKPAVVNLSIGSTIGPHDGSDATSQMIDILADDAIIFLAAGNEGDMPLSIVKTFTGSDTEVKTFPFAQASFTGIYDFYSNDATPFDLTIFIYDREKKATTYEYTISGGKDGETTISGSGYNVASYIKPPAFEKAYDSKSYLLCTASTNKSTNNRYSVRVQASLTYATSNRTRNFVWGVKLSGKAGQTVSATVNSSSPGMFSSLNEAGFTAGNADLSISSMACAKKAIAVGAYNARNTWPVVSGLRGATSLAYADMTGLQVGEIAGYSSYGTLVDGRQLPIVYAPGTAIISSISTPYYNQIPANDPYGEKENISAIINQNDRLNYWQAQQGTSMATPIVAGAVALWLEADPTLTVDDVKSIIANNAKTPIKAPGARAANPAGLLNAFEGMKYVIEHSSGVTDVAVDSDDLMLNFDGSQWEAFVAGADSVKADIYTVAGRLAASASADGSSVRFSTDNLAKGIYIVNVNGTYSRRIVVK